MLALFLFKLSNIRLIIYATNTLFYDIKLRSRCVFVFLLWINHTLPDALSTQRFVALRIEREREREHFIF